MARGALWSHKTVDVSASAWRWTTADEIAYLKRIGQTGGLTAGFSRTELLENYILAASMRTRWEHLDGAYILATARGLLDMARQDTED